jgi:N-acyl-D-amino-acid deacylase
MLDILVKNATVIDGSGGAPHRADVGIADGRIALVSPVLSLEAARTIDAQGLHLAPGFIDPHSHSDLTLLVDPLAQSKIRQGVTTEIVGNCGSSAGPLQGAAIAEVQARTDPLGLEVSWSDLSGYIERLRSGGTAVNVVPLVGHNTVRGAVLGYGDVQPDGAQLAAMEVLVADSMEQGARGLSTGLFYPPGHYAHTEEVVALARVAARYGGTYFSHIRSESDRGLSAVAEAVEIGRLAEIPIQIAHLKLAGCRNWSKIEALVALLGDSSHTGVQVGADQYPYDASSCWLAAMLPYWAQEGGAKVVGERLREADVRAELRRDWERDREGWENRAGVGDWRGIVISECEACPEALGRSIAEIAAESGDDPLEVSLDLIAESEGQVGCVWHGQSEEVVRTLMQLPIVGPGSDGYSLSPDGALGRRKCHPRSYGTFPRVLGKYAREEGVLKLAEAVRKMTAMPAGRFGLVDRGMIREGAWADIVLFDAATVRDRATFSDPHQYPVGIPYVVVNGQIVVDGGAHTGALPGRVL